MTHALANDAARLVLYLDGPEGRIDGFAAQTLEAGRDLLARALDVLGEAGCARALGPIGPDTWGPYRLVIESDGTPAFPGEPQNPLFYADCFADAGFSPVATYRSTLDTDPKRPERAPPADLRIGEWNPDNPDADIEALHALAQEAFAGAPFFRPIPLERFSALHAPLLASLPPRYCLVGRNAGEKIVSALLGYPSAAGLVLKSLMSARPGAGSALVDEFYRRAVADGQRAIVHALMHEANRSTGMSRRREARPFRRYALFGRAL